MHSAFLVLIGASFEAILADCREKTTSSSLLLCSGVLEVCLHRLKLVFLYKQVVKIRTIIKQTADVVIAINNVLSWSADELW